MATQLRIIQEIFNHNVKGYRVIEVFSESSDKRRAKGANANIRGEIEKSLLNNCQWYKSDSPNESGLYAFYLSFLSWRINQK